MKRVLTLVLALLMVTGIFASCTKTPPATTDNPTPSGSTPSASESVTVPTPTPSDAPTVSESPSPSPSVSPEPQPEPLPSSASLLGTKHLPIIDSQGSIGCCTSEGVTYAQFTVAVSQYINNKDPNSAWDPSSGNPSYIFSPKYTYNFSGSGTDICYQVLRDNGCLPMSLSSFEKTAPAPDGSWGGSILTAEKSRGWDVGSPDLMLSALNYRITNYEEIEFTATNAGKLTTNEQGQQLLYKVKDAINRGNVVAVCGWSAYWQYDTIDPNGTGTLGKRGDSIIWNGYKNEDSTSDGNHCVALVGYDDDITFTRAGVTMKGAFLMMNSWGTGYYQDGFCWLAYDACNVESEFEIFNDPDFYDPCVALSPTTLKSVSPMKNNHEIRFTFTPVATEQEIEGQKCTVYTLSTAQGKYLSYNAKGEVSLIEKADESCHFAVLDSKQTDDYAGSKYLYAVNNGKSPLRYLAFKGTTAGASVELIASPETKKSCTCLKINESSANNDGVFMDMVNTVPTGRGNDRTGTLYRFSFLYWDEDVIVGPSQLSVEVQVSAADRSTLYMSLNRTDKNGVQDTFSPASMELRYRQHIVPETAEIKEGETLSFSGKLNPTEAEDGYFVFSYDTLCGFNSNLTYEDFLWGVTVRGSGVTIKRLRLLDEQGKELFCVVPDQTTGELQKGDVHSFVFDAGKELESYFGTGTYRLKNVGTGKILNLKTNNMIFEWFDGKKTSEERTAFSISYDKKGDFYTFTSYKGHVFDIHGTEIKDGTVVKMNAANNGRPAQKWAVTRTEEGYLRIALKADPTYCFGYDKDFCIKKSSDKNFLWVLEPIETATINLDVSHQGSEVTVKATAHKDYEGGILEVKVVKDGQVVTTIRKEAENKVMTDTVTLEKGTYLFTMIYNGQVVGTQTIYTVS
ncbi:MAG: hypothetical protein J6M12_05550 [Clostridia bacterium]|nr:hypothetical protein [Clostridia bacterium]